MSISQRLGDSKLQNGFIHRVLKTKRISYSDRFVGHLDQGKAIYSVLAGIPKEWVALLVIRCRSLGTMLSGEVISGLTPKLKQSMDPDPPRRELLVVLSLQVHVFVMLWMAPMMACSLQF